MSTTHEEQLRLWAKGLYPLEAGTELLIRGFGGRFASPGMSWIKEFDDESGYWIDFEEIEPTSGMLSGGERRFLLLAASIAEGVEVKVGDVISGLDVGNVRLVLAAIAHGAGMKELYPYPPL